MNRSFLRRLLVPQRPDRPPHPLPQRHALAVAAFQHGLVVRDRPHFGPVAVALDQAVGGYPDIAVGSGDLRRLRIRLFWV